MRNHLIATLLNLAYLLSDRKMRALHKTHIEMFRTFPSELKSGRTYGVISAIWFLNKKDAPKAEKIQAAGHAAMKIQRSAFEVSSAPTSGHP